MMSAINVSRARCGILHAASQNRDPGWRSKNRDPGSAAHRSAKSYALRCVRGTLNLAPLFRGERSTRIVRCAAGEGPGTKLPNEKNRVERSSTQQARPES